MINMWRNTVLKLICWSLPEQSLFFVDMEWQKRRPCLQLSEENRAGGGERAVKVNHFRHTHKRISLRTVGEVSWFSWLYGLDVCECAHKFCMQTRGHSLWGADEWFLPKMFGEEAGGGKNTTLSLLTVSLNVSLTLTFTSSINDVLRKCSDSVLKINWTKGSE